MEKKERSRESYGTIASIVGILSNLVLAGGKIIVGMLFGVISVMADGFNNLTDCGSSIMSFISFKISSKPADKEHPFGHERIEYIASMIVSFLILLIAFELVKESITNIISATALEFSYIIIAVLLASIAIKCGLFFYNRAVGKKINSDILKATAVDCLSDCISTSVVLIAIIIGKLTGFNIDGYAGVLVAVFIAIAGIKILVEMISKLIGQAPDAELLQDIKKRILAHKTVLGIHDLNVYSYGPSKFFASVHIELAADLDPLVAHEMIDDIEKEFLQNTNIALTGHYDPIVVDDDEVNEMRKKVAKIVKNISKEYSMHDFRMVKGPHNTNIIFDVAIPFDAKHSEEEIKQSIVEHVAKIDTKYTPVIIVEKQTYIS